MYDIILYTHTYVQCTHTLIVHVNKTIFHTVTTSIV